MIDLKEVCNPVQLQAFIEFEKVILGNVEKFTGGKLGKIIDAIFGKEPVKVFGLFNFNPSTYFRESKDKALDKPLKWLYSKIDELEQTIYPIMLEDGTINGTALNAILKDKKPQLYYLVNIPKEKFKLAEFAERIMSAFTIIG